MKLLHTKRLLAYALCGVMSVSSICAWQIMESPIATYSYAADQTGTVTCSTLNVRSGAGTSYSVQGTLKKDTKVTILKTSGDWYQISYKSGSTTKKGYVAKKYIKVSSTSSSSTSSTSTKTGTVTCSTLNVRSGAGTSYSIQGSIKKDTKVTILKTSGDWYQISYKSGSTTKKGYVAKKYIKVSSSTSTSSSSSSSTSTSTSTNKTGVVTASVLNVRTGAGTKYSIQGTIKKDTKVTILKTSGDWYQISYKSGTTTKKGYVSKSYIKVTSSSSSSSSSSSTSSSDSFKADLEKQGFPSSYVTELMKLHEKYPNWKFVAVKTGIDWETATKNEKNKSGSVKNVIYCTSSSPHYNWRSTSVGYDYKTDKYTSFDGSNWYAASDKLVEYYMDPRSYLDENNIFAFESLNYVEGGQSQAGVEAILSGTFMANAVPTGSTKKYSAIMMSAAKSAGVSPYFVASRIKAEVGASTPGASVNGKHATYPGIYNFYNIGAYDSASGNAVSNGLKWASSGSTYSRPWKTPEKSIVGGASYIGSSFINKGQNTLYTQKFNVTNKTDGLYAHQYQSNIQAPMTEGSKIASAYANQGMKSDKITFNIPVYNNMPSTKVSKPSDSGSPNNYLKTLTVDGYTLSPAFSVGDTKEYTLKVSSSVSTVKISASTVNANATVSGTGSKTLKSGDNTYTITVTAQNGSTRKYTVTITK